MILTAHQPNYLPYPGFFNKILHADAFVIVDTTQFVKRGPFGWIHRNRIRTDSQQGWGWLTVPVLSKGKFSQAIADTKINNAQPWSRKHLKALEWNYRKAPYFNRYHKYFKEVYGRRWEHIAELGEEIIRFVLFELDVKIPVHKTSELGVTGKAGELIIDMCRVLGADTYISGIHGKDYLEVSIFEDNDIKLIFQEYEPREYPQQFGGEFIPNLAIFDMLMNCGPERTRALLGADAPGV